MNESMNKQEFIQELIEYLNENKGNDVEVSVRSFVKTNDTKVEAINLISKNVTATRNFYTEELYKRYCCGSCSIETLGNEMLQLSKEDVPVEINFASNLFSCLSDLDSLLGGHVCIRLVNLEKNKEFLLGKTYLPFLDLATVFYCVVNKESEQMTSVAIPKSCSDKWDISLEEALDKVLEDMTIHFPIERKALGDMIEGILCDDTFGDVMNPPELELPACSPRIYCQTNTYKLNGAATILYKNALKELAEKLSVDILYIIPSSIHETLIIPEDEDIVLEGLKELIKDVNTTTVSPNEVLSDNLYVYDAVIDEIRIF